MPYRYWIFIFSFVGFVLGTDSCILCEIGWICNRVVLVKIIINQLLWYFTFTCVFNFIIQCLFFQLTIYLLQVTSIQTEVKNYIMYRNKVMHKRDKPFQLHFKHLLIVNCYITQMPSHVSDLLVVSTIKLRKQSLRFTYQPNLMIQLRQPLPLSLILIIIIIIPTRLVIFFYTLIPTYADIFTCDNFVSVLEMM